MMASSDLDAPMLTPAAVLMLCLSGGRGGCRQPVAVVVGCALIVSIAHFEVEIQDYSWLVVEPYPSGKYEFVN